MAAVFETVRLEPTGVRLLSQHLERARRAGVAESTLQLARKRLRDQLVESPCVVRLDFPDGEPRLTRRPAPDRDPALLALAPGYDPGNTAREEKRTERTWALPAVAAARAVGASDVLFISTGALVSETTVANVLVELADGTLATPPVAGLLPGITRGYALAELGAIERPLVVSDLATARAVVLANAARGFWPVQAIGVTEFDSLATSDRLHERWLALAPETP